MRYARQGTGTWGRVRPALSVRDARGQVGVDAAAFLKFYRDTVGGAR